MSESELEEEVKKIRTDLDTLIKKVENLDSLNKKIDLLIEKSKEKDSILESFKDSYKLFFAGILGVVSADLINSYYIKPSYGLLGEILGTLLGFSIFFSILLYYTFRIPKKWKRRKKCFKPFQ